MSQPTSSMRIESLYEKIQVPDAWAQGLEEAIAAVVAVHSTDTTAEQELLATQCQRSDAERFKLMETYYAGAIDVAMLRQSKTA